MTVFFDFSKGFNFAKSAFSNSTADQASTAPTQSTSQLTTKYTDKQMLIGCVFAYYDNSYNEETVKAISKIVVNNYEINKNINTDDKNVFINEQDMKKECGESFDTIYKKIESAISEASSTKFLYNKKQVYIPACKYTNGQTATSDQYPYLDSVASPWDTLNSNYTPTTTAVYGVSIAGVDRLIKNGDTVDEALKWYLPQIEITNK